ncbi:MAG: hypothetical protein HKP58_03480 [Desulfatitalea sp.]|nr:exodeoxyribonuclease V subunit gamma [Desulfatitalea sp.]NNJ99453.1 hypothetical protein [Desulfatitalea sp.]
MFGTRSDDRTHLPYSVADQTIQSENPVALAFIKRLNMVGGCMNELKARALIRLHFNTCDF